MKKLLISLLLVLLLPTFAPANICTSSGNGNWDGATDIWTGTDCDGIAHPVAGDTTLINHAVTIPVGVAATSSGVVIGNANAASLTINGKLTVSVANQHIKIGNGSGKDGTLTFGPGGELALDASTNQLWLQNGYLRSTATKISPAKITGAGPITSSVTVTDGINDVDISNISFQNLGNIAISSRATTGVGTPQIYVSDCVFSGNGSVAFGVAAMENTIPLSITDSDFREATNPIIIIQRVTGGAPAYEFKRNTVYKASAASLYEIRHIASTGLDISDNVIVNGYISGTTSAGGATITDNFLTQAGTGTVVIMSDAAVGDTVSYNYTVSTADNAHPFMTSGSGGTGTHSVTYNIEEGIVDGTWTGLPDFFMPGATPISHSVQYNIGINTGIFTSTTASNYGAGSCVIKNNTNVATIASALGLGTYLFQPEGAALAGTINIANNLQSGNGALSEFGLTKPNSGTMTIASSDYNSIYNVATPYSADASLVITAGNTGKTVPGSHDIAQNPKHVDATRTLAKWDARFGSGTGTSATGVTYLLGKNGYRGTPNFDQNGTASVYGPAHLVDWVRYGFSPTNGALRKAGDPADGSPTIGAVEWQNPRRKR